MMTMAKKRLIQFLFNKEASEVLFKLGPSSALFGLFQLFLSLLLTFAFQTNLIDNTITLGGCDKRNQGTYSGSFTEWLGFAGSVGLLHVRMNERICFILIR